MNDIQHPDITAIERTGYPDGYEDIMPRCPKCGSETDTIYINIDNEIMGCDGCLRARDAWDDPRCFSEEEEE